MTGARFLIAIGTMDHSEEPRESGPMKQAVRIGAAREPTASLLGVPLLIFLFFFLGQLADHAIVDAHDCHQSENAQNNHELDVRFHLSFLSVVPFRIFAKTRARS
jgi:hypothetical protein